MVTLYKIGEGHFRLLGMNDFHVKTENERLSAECSRCGQNLKYENFTSSFCRPRQKIAPKSVPHVQRDYFSLFNQSHYRCEALPLPSSFLKLPNMPISTESRDTQTPLKREKAGAGKHVRFTLSLACLWMVEILTRDFSAIHQILNR